MRTTKTLIQSTGFVLHGNSTCLTCGGDNYPVGITAVKRTYCECGEVTHSDETVPVAFADGETGEVSAERVDQFAKNVRDSDKLERFEHVHRLGLAAALAVELRAAGCEETRRMGELQRVVRDMISLLVDFRCEHERFCACPLCAFWASADRDTAEAARSTLGLARTLRRVADKFLEKVEEAAPEARRHKHDVFIRYSGGPFHQRAEIGGEGIERARQRLTAFREAVQPGPAVARGPHAFGVPFGGIVYAGSIPADEVTTAADDDANGLAAQVDELPDAIAERLAGGAGL